MKFKALSLSVAAIVMSAFSAAAYDIHPVPQSATLTGSSLSLTSRVNIVASDGTDAVTLDRLKEVLDNAGIAYDISASRSTLLTNILLGVYGSGDDADAYSTSISLGRSIFPAAEGRFDPHSIAIDADAHKGTIMILGDNNGSAFYACASLEQILEQRDAAGNLPTVRIEDYAHVRLRGIVEGFYGHPYSAESRLNMLDFCKRFKLNCYVYGPKHDPYHAGSWRQNYPETVSDQQRAFGHLTRDDIRALTEKSRKCGVDFVWSIHPALQGGGISFYNLDPGVADIITKFGYMYDLGVRHFGVSVDDISGHPSTQGELAQKVQTRLNELYNTADATPDSRVGGILFVPTGYALNYSGATSVLRQFSSVSSEIDIAFTGYDCFSNIRQASFTTAAQYTGRSPIFWWNNPVNDDYDDFLYMHGLTARWTIENSGPISSMGGLLLNPMNQAGPSKIAIFNAADYSWNPSAFNADSSWEASIKAIMKDDRYADALKTFISMVSAYTTTATGGSDSSRPNGFNSCKNKAPEGETHAKLFSDFIAAFSRDNVPDATELRAVIADAVQACATLRELAHDSDADRRLFFREMSPWFLKIEEMCHIAHQSLELMAGGTSDDALDHWTAGVSLAGRASSYHSSDDFLVSILEGSASSPREVFIEALPAPHDFEPFIDFLADEIGRFAPALPQRSRDFEIITNLSPVPASCTLSVNESEGTVTLGGLRGTVLRPGEYIGIYLNRLTEASVEAADTDAGLELQYSVNGKQWMPCSSATEGTLMAYLRLKNTSAADVTVDRRSSLTCDMPVISAPATVSPVASTNLGTYSTYVISNILDGNTSTHFWSDAAPVGGSSYIRIDMGATVPLTDIKLTFCSGDRPTGTVSLQTSDDASTWSTLCSFTADDITGSTYTASAAGTTARYVRLFFVSANTTHWFQLAEFEVGYSTSATSAIDVAEDHNGSFSAALDDRSLTSSYIPSEAGHLTYTFIENIYIEEIHIFHNSSFSSDAQLPSVRVLADGQWHDLGYLGGERTIFDTRSLKNISQARIEWNAVNRPGLYEIMPVGTPYVESASPSAIGSVTADSDDICISVTDGGLVTITASQPVSTVIVTDITGRVIARIAPASAVASLRIGAPGLYIISAVTHGGASSVHKVSVR